MGFDCDGGRGWTEVKRDDKGRSWIACGGATLERSMAAVMSSHVSCGIGMPAWGCSGGEGFGFAVLVDMVGRGWDSVYPLLGMRWKGLGGRGWRR